MSDLSFEISQEEFSALPENDRLLIDIRDQASISYGMIPGALHVPQENVPEWADTPKAFSKCIVLYCSRGIFSLELAAKLQERGLNARCLQDGYNGWLLFSMKKENNKSGRIGRQVYNFGRCRSGVDIHFHNPHI